MAGSIAGSMAGKRTHRFNLNAPRDTPLAVHFYTPSTPASAIADRIFNDPESWKTETRFELSKEDVAAWEMFDHLPEVPSGPDSADFTLTLKPFTHKFKLNPRPDLMSPESDLESDTETPHTWEGVNAKDKVDEVPFITFSVVRPGMDKLIPSDRMSILWAHGNLFRSPHLYASPPASPATDATLGRPSSPLNPSTASTPRSAFVPHASPLGKASKSATWSILEYYGVSLPETPRTADSTSFRRASAHFLHIPSQPSAPPPPVPRLPATATTTTTPSAVAISSAASETASPSLPAARAPTPPSTTGQGRTLPANRAHSGSVRPLPAIPKQAPPVPSLDPPTAWSRPRASTTNVRSLPVPPIPPSHRSLTIPQPAPLPTTRHKAALSLS
ncbi:hypothetical protein B0H19DRAFT_1065049 [Mycena capillaripes]|nr:hypothetical protein B0H19DRAFT_1065049 [Mycena capillaripes]